MSERTCRVARTACLCDWLGTRVLTSTAGGTMGIMRLAFGLAGADKVGESLGQNDVIIGVCHSDAFW